METSLKMVYENNLCTHYILPLVGMNMFKFGNANFLNCFVHQKGTHVFIRVCDPYETEETFYNPAYRKHMKDGNAWYLCFEIKDKWRDTVQLFREGRYTEFSDEAKETIRVGSGLAWQRRDYDGSVRTDARLMSMFPEKSEFRRWLASELDVHIDDLPKELISPPKDSEFIDIEV